MCDRLPSAFCKYGALPNSIMPFNSGRFSCRDICRMLCLGACHAGRGGLRHITQANCASVVRSCMHVCLRGCVRQSPTICLRILNVLLLLATLVYHGPPLKPFVTHTTGAGTRVAFGRDCRPAGRWRCFGVCRLPHASGLAGCRCAVWRRRVRIGTSIPYDWIVGHCFAMVAAVSSPPPLFLSHETYIFWTTLCRIFGTGRRRRVASVRWMRATMKRTRFPFSRAQRSWFPWYRQGRVWLLSWV